MRSARIPRVVVLTWALALVILGVVAVAAARFLAGTATGTGHPMADRAMAGMSGAQALARGGAGPLHSPLLGWSLVTAWQLDAVALAVLVPLGAMYLSGIAIVRRRGGSWPAVHAASFLAGLLTCAFATNGSIAVYDQALFTAHMAGHLALVMVAPVLLVGGRPLRLWLAVCPPGRAERIRQVLDGRVLSVLTAPPVALACYAAVIVGSHLTGLMDVIMRNTWAGQVEHLVYVVVGCQFFALVVGDEPIRWRLSVPARWLLLAVAMAVDTFTGIVLLQGTTAVRLGASSLSVDALSDTRTGGAIMWFGGDAIMAVVMIALVIGWLRRAEGEPEVSGWLEQARATTFAGHVASAAGAYASTVSVASGTAGADDAVVPSGVDPVVDSEDARDAYNAWLAELARRG